jgi:GNAT superfamily N-acetyltransferase
MKIPDGYTELPPGKIASVVTYLEMRSRPKRAAVPRDAAWFLRQIHAPDLDLYRRLFRTIGERWLWFSRLRMDDETLRKSIDHPAVDLFVLEIEGKEKGLLELDRRHMPEIELAFIGLSADAIGKGAGHFLLDQAIDLAWAHHPTRFVVHTCTLDHPRALEFYIRSGFVPYKRAIEIADDPRIDGTLSKDAVPWIPIL